MVVHGSRRSSERNQQQRVATPVQPVVEEESVELSSDEDERKPRFVYRHEDGSVELHLASLECLESDDSYLKDNIVQFYSAYLLYSICDTKTRQRVHIFDSIFYEQLTKVFTKNKVDGNRFKQVRKWYRGIDLFKRDFIVFPICSSDHWSAIVVCYPRNVADCPPGGPKEDAGDNQPGIIVLDSLNLSCSGLIEKIASLIDFEWRVRCSSVKRFSVTDLKTHCPELPKQTNTYDCGLYMLAYIECLLQDPDAFYRSVQKSEKGKGLRKSIDGILKKTDRSALRSLIRKQCEHM